MPICIYETGDKDYTGNGLGVLTPTACAVTEEAGGRWELAVTLPVTDDLKSRLLSRGRVIRAPVPAMTTPALTVLRTKQEAVASEGLAVYAPKASRERGTWVNLRVLPNDRVLERLYAGDNVILLEPIESTWAAPDWAHVVSPRGQQGWVLASSLVKLWDLPPGAKETIWREVVPARQVKDQLFRIYEVQEAEDGGSVTAMARHISYDLMYNAVARYAPSGPRRPADLADGLLAAAENGAMGFEIVTNCEDKLEWTADKQNLIEALLTPESGLAARLRCQVVRDNFTIYLLKNEPRDRGVQIAYGKNLLGVSVKVNDENVYTRLIPLGQDGSGNPVRMAEGHLDSPAIGLYPYPRCKLWQVPGAKVGGKRTLENGTEVTLDLAGVQAWLKEEAQKLLDAGCDLADMDMTVSFQELGATEEYAGYADLQQIFLYDTVRILHGPRGIRQTAQVCGYTYDCLAGRYEEIKLGDVFADRLGGVISGGAIASGTIPAGKLGYGSVDTGNLRELAVVTANMANAAITAAKIADAAITTAKIEDAAITTAKIGDAQITKAKIKDFEAEVAEIAVAEIGKADIDAAKIGNLSAKVAEIVKADIGAMDVDWASITALTTQMAEVAAARIKDADIDAAQIRDLYAEVMKAVVANIGTADIDWADIAALSAATAEIVEASIQQADIDFAQIKNLIAGTSIITQGEAGELYIADLRVTEANIVSLTVGELVLRDKATGGFVTVHVDEDGNLYTTPKQVDGDDLAPGSVDGTKIIETSIQARHLDVRDIFADNAVIRQLMAANIDVDVLFAREAMAGKITTNMLASDVGANLVISGGRTIAMMAGELDELRAVFVIDAAGTHVRSRDGLAEVATTPQGITLRDEQGVITTRIEAGEMQTRSVRAQSVAVGQLITRELSGGLVAEMWEDA